MKEQNEKKISIVDYFFYILFIIFFIAIIYYFRLSNIALGLSCLAILIAIIIYFRTGQILDRIEQNMNKLIDDTITARENKVQELIKEFTEKKFKFISKPSGIISPDIIFKKNDKVIPVEIKIYPKKLILNDLIDKLRKQMYNYMNRFDTDNSILILYAPDITKKAYKELTKPFDDGKIIIVKFFTRNQIGISEKDIVKQIDEYLKKSN